LTAAVKDKVGTVLRQGSIVADPRQWDGGLAGKWRHDWLADATQLKQTAAKLDELERRAQHVIDDIFKADTTPPPATTHPPGNVPFPAANPMQSGGTSSPLTDALTWPIPSGPSNSVPSVPPFTLSFEMQKTFGLVPSVDPDGSRFDKDQDAVLSWIELNRETILREARARKIPPAAIADAVAWEALENPESFHWPLPPTFPIVPRRADGPGKVHVDGPLVHQLEDRGYLSRLSLSERESVLSTDEGSIRYIAAAMGAFADVTDKNIDKNHPFPSIRNNVPMLLQCYQSNDLDTWQHHLDDKWEKYKNTGNPQYLQFEPKEKMATWAEGLGNDGGIFPRPHPQRPNYPEFLSAIDDCLNGQGKPQPGPPEENFYTL
jgi:hypothetical protein